MIRWVCFVSRVSKQKIERIVELWLAGLPRDAIAQRLKVSGSTVSKYVNQFKGSVSQKAAELLEGLRLLSAELKKSGKTLSEALNIAKVYNTMERIGVRAEDLEHFIVASKRTAKELGIEAEDYVKAAIKIAKLETETGKSYKEIARDFEEKVDMIAQLNQKIEQLNKKKNESKRELQKQLRQQRLARKDIAFALTLRYALTPHGFTLKDVSKIPRLVKHIKNCRQNVKKVLTKLERIDNLENTLATLKKQKETEKNDLETIEHRLDEAEKQHSRLLEKIETLQQQEKESTIKISEHQITLVNLKEEEKRLILEIDIMEKKIEIADCITSVLLTKKPVNIDSLHFFVSGLKKIKDDPTANLDQYRKFYEPKIRELLVETFLSAFHNEFVRKSDYEHLEKQLKPKLKDLDDENKTLKITNSQLTDRVKELEEENKKLKKKIELRDTLEKEATERHLKFDFPTGSH